MRTRFLIPELMDDPTILESEHRRALAGLKRINQISRTASILGRTMMDSILSGSKQHSPKNPRQGVLRILDIASGGGEVTAGVFRFLQRQSIRCDVTGWDISPQAIQISSERFAKTSSAGELKFERQDFIAGLETIDEPFDIIFCSLFLHHLTDEQATRLLILAKKNVRLAVMVDDLIRSRIGYWLAHLGCRILSRSSIVHFDGPQSVRAAFRCEEVRELAWRAGMENVLITSHWPRRFTLLWKRENSPSLPPLSRKQVFE